jgi:DNA-binding MarR family transcriptional regulator
MKARSARASRVAPSDGGANVDELAAEIMHTLAELLRSFKGRVIAASAALDLTPPQADLLRRLDPSQPIPMGALAEALTCDASNVTGLVDRLEARGLIERLSQPRDRRVKAIALTKEGVAAREKFLAIMCEAPRSLERASARDLGAAASVLGALRAALQPGGGTGDPESPHAKFVLAPPAPPTRPRAPARRRARPTVSR